MILSVTMNPSVDISYPLAHFVLDSVNRVTDVKKTAGGKGLNVTRGIHLSGYPVTATGLIGGTTGEYIKKQLDSDHIQYNFYETNYESRNCIAILHQGCQTEILEAGPEMTNNEIDGFWQHFKQLLCGSSVITISGSMPCGFPVDYYARMIELAAAFQIPTLLDCSGKTLQASLSGKTKPFLIKPNHEELGQLIGINIDPNNLIQLQSALLHEKLCDIPVIVVSLGKYGAVVKYHQTLYRATIPTINVVNPVGSGDVTLGGLAVGIVQKEAFPQVIKRAMTMGMLNAMEKQTGFINMDNYQQYFDLVNVVEINND